MDRPWVFALEALSHDRESYFHPPAAEQREPRVIFHPSNSRSLEASSYIPNSPVFEVAGSQVSAACYVGFTNGHT